MKETFLYIMSAAYAFAGALHFLRPRMYKSIMPPWLPWHYPLVYISGIAEILIALLLIPTVTRTFAAWALIILLIAIFPANIYMAQKYYAARNPYLWVALLRLPLQGVLIWLAWKYT